MATRQQPGKRKQTSPHAMPPPLAEAAAISAEPDDPAELAQQALDAKCIQRGLCFDADWLSPIRFLEGCTGDRSEVPGILERLAADPEEVLKVGEIWRLVGQHLCNGPRRIPDWYDALKLFLAASRVLRIWLRPTGLGLAPLAKAERVFQSGSSLGHSAWLLASSGWYEDARAAFVAAGDELSGAPDALEAVRAAVETTPNDNASELPALAAHLAAPADAEPVAAKADPIDKNARVMGLLAAHPDWTDTEIAKAAGVSRTSLYRWSKFKLAREAQRQTASPDHGQKGRDGRIEAWADNRDEESGRDA
jgi:hypothetical protein